MAPTATPEQHRHLAVVALGVLVATVAGVVVTFTVAAAFRFSCSAGALGAGVSSRRADLALLVSWLAIGVAAVITLARSGSFGTGLARQSIASAAVAMAEGIVLAVIL